MRSAIIKGLIPIFVFLAFADGSRLGLQYGASGGLIILLVLNFTHLRKGILFDCLLGVAFLALLILKEMPMGYFLKYNLPIAYLIFTVIVFLTVSLKKPFVLSHARMKAPPIYQNSPFLIFITQKLAIAWGIIFLLCAGSSLVYSLNLGNKLWFVEIVPTALVIIGLFITIIAPDNFQRRLLKLGGISSLSNLSDIKTLSFQDVTIAYRTIGKGPTLILLNGFLMNMHSWDADFIKRLSQHYQVFLFDYPGVGYSLGEKFEFNHKTLSNLLHEIIHRLNLKPKAIIGYSMGGFIAQVFAKHFSKMIDAMVLIGTDSGSRIISDRFEQLSGFAKELLEHQTLAKLEEGVAFLFPKETLARSKERFMKQMMAASFEGENTKRGLEQEMAFIQAWYQMPYPLDLSNITLNTLLMFGEKDEVIPAENSQRLQKQLKQVSVSTYPDAGHGLIYQYPIDAAEQIESFLINLSSQNHNAKI